MKPDTQNPARRPTVYLKLGSTQGQCARCDICALLERPTASRLLASAAVRCDMPAQPTTSPAKSGRGSEAAPDSCQNLYTWENNLIPHPHPFWVQGTLQVLHFKCCSPLPALTNLGRYPIEKKTRGVISVLMMPHEYPITGLQILQGPLAVLLRLPHASPSSTNILDTPLHLQQRDDLCLLQQCCATSSGRSLLLPCSSAACHLPPTSLALAKCAYVRTRFPRATHHM